VGIGEYLARRRSALPQSEEGRLALGAGSNVKPRRQVCGIAKVMYFIHMNARAASGWLLFWHFPVSSAFNEQSAVLAASFLPRRAIYQGDHWILEKRTNHQSLEEQRQPRVDLINQLRWESGLSPSVLSVIDCKARRTWR